MAVYLYSANLPGDVRAAVRRGTIVADGPRQARDRLRAQGLAVLELEEQRAERRPSWLARYLSGRQASQVTTLLQEMATLQAAGIPLLETLDTIMRQHSGRFQRSIMLLRDHVSAGGSLAQAMTLQPELFDELCINIVEVGENAGTLDTALARLVEYRRRQAQWRNRVGSALIYPAIVLAVAVVVSIFLMTYVVPNLLSVLVDSGRSLPWATVVVKTLSDALRTWGWALALAAIGVGGVLTAILRTEAGARRWHRWQLRLPLLGDLIRKQAIARMALVLATLLKSDVMFVRAVQIAQRTVRNRVLRDALVACEQAVCAGRDISAALEKTQAFPPLVIQVFAVGQASGNLESMLENLAHDYDTQVDLVSGRLTALLEPLMMILLALMVGFIAFATILPILEAGNVL